jgi:hypothetical protein
LTVKPRNTFVTGFVTAVLLWLAWWLYSNGRFQGGHAEDSPSARFTVSLMAPLEPTDGGTYVVSLTDKATGKLLRTHAIRLNSGEKTKAIRELPVSMKWDATESHVDVAIDGAFLIRLAVPTPTSSTESRTNQAMEQDRDSVLRS